ncbi:hypothetical protein [Sinorhizobium sp. RAC02]|uniref:hypothetical protein n=1 Tax=Sinorhizobium sp. RAC02 TaxID=1842534 RepID=UPI00083E2515|nr:hypothetical protein [Sinorhizobium sp. RAC02]AOF94279.1 hypothetical protein BSY16_5032 [Sinorhizobium sp. RAC02]
MAHALNLTMPLKQDVETQKTLAHIKSIFADNIQPLIDAALRKSEIVHFGRVLVIDDKYIQVITEYDGGHKEYTEFFRRQLPDVFKTIFSLVEGAPDWNTMDEHAFFEFAKKHQITSLGRSTTGDTGVTGEAAGYLFCAYDDREVRDLLPLLKD